MVWKVFWTIELFLDVAFFYYHVLADPFYICTDYTLVERTGQRISCLDKLLEYQNMHYSNDIFLPKQEEILYNIKLAKREIVFFCSFRYVFYFTCIFFLIYMCFFILHVFFTSYMFFILHVFLIHVFYFTYIFLIHMCYLFHMCFLF